MRVMSWTLVPGLLLLCAALAPIAMAEEGEDAIGGTLVVATKEAPPFAMKGADGSWEGISIELWRGIAEDVGCETTFQETDLEGLLAGVQEGKMDAAVAALTVTAEREKVLDFTHAFYTSGLGIAVPASQEAGWSTILANVFSGGFLRAVLALAGILGLAGVLLWLFERRRNAEQFGGRPAQGLGNAFWWSAVTMTTVGYGDKAPVTLGGRLVGLVWMFASIILIAGFTASIASALTVSELEGSIHGPEDLPGLTVGTVRDSTSERYLRRQDLSRKRFATVKEAMLALAEGKVDAVVYDRPLLVWLAAREGSLEGRVSVLPRTFERQDYAIALPAGSEYRERINRVLLRRIGADEWDDVLERYLGR